MPSSIIDAIDEYMQAVFAHIDACLKHAQTAQAREFSHIGWHRAMQSTLNDVDRTYKALRRMQGGHEGDGI